MWIIHVLIIIIILSDDVVLVIEQRSSSRRPGKRCIWRVMLLLIRLRRTVRSSSISRSRSSRGCDPAPSQRRRSRRSAQEMRTPGESRASSGRGWGVRRRHSRRIDVQLSQPATFFKKPNEVVGGAETAENPAAKLLRDRGVLPAAPIVDTSRVFVPVFDGRETFRSSLANKVKLSMKVTGLLTSRNLSVLVASTFVRLGSCPALSTAT
jgi:hypothetical protein